MPFHTCSIDRKHLTVPHTILPLRQRELARKVADRLQHTLMLLTQLGTPRHGNLSSGALLAQCGPQCKVAGVRFNNKGLIKAWQVKARHSSECGMQLVKDLLLLQSPRDCRGGRDLTVAQ